MHRLLLLGSLLYGCGTDNLVRPSTEPAPAHAHNTPSVCTTTTSQIPPTPAVLFVVDRSTSMAQTQAWDSVKQALTHTLETLSHTAHTALMLYPPPSGRFQEICAAGTLQVPLQPHNTETILQALNSTTPFGNTPTAASLQQAAVLFSTLPLDTPKALVLITDGGPGCNPSLNPRTCTCIPGAVCISSDLCLDDTRTYQTLKDIHADGIDIFVVGVEGSSNVSTVLEQMAQAGGKPQHYPAYNTQALTQALNSIFTQIQRQTSCL